MTDLTANQQRECLIYTPFDDDTPTRVFRDVFRHAGKPHRCATCFGTIFRGEHHRARTEKDLTDLRGAPKTFRFCCRCCLAMAASWEDDGATIGFRETLGQIRAGALTDDMLEFHKNGLPDELLAELENER